MESGTQWVVPGDGATLRQLLEAVALADGGTAIDVPTSLRLTGFPIDKRDRERIKEVVRRVAEYGEDRG